MLIKNMGTYRVKGFDVTDEKLNEAAELNKFVQCKPHEESKFGWIPPFGAESSNFAPSANGFIALCVQFEKRPVSASQVKMILVKEIAELKLNNPDIIITGKVKKNMRDDIKSQLQPNAPSNVSEIKGFIDAKQGIIYIDGTPAKCEKFVGALKFLLPSLDLDILPIQTMDEPKTVMTSWVVEDKSPDLIEFGNTFSLRDEDDLSEITYKKVDSFLDESLKKYLNDSKRVISLKVEYDANTSFTISEDFQISGVSWGDDVLEEAQSDYSDIPGATVDDIGSAELGCVALKSREILNYLLESCFGGEKSVEDEDEEDGEGDFNE